MQESKQETLKCTIFARWNDHGELHGNPCMFPHFAGEPEALQDRIDFVASCTGLGKFIPIAWCDYKTKLESFKDKLAESIAAGRLIEQIDGKWIARGLDLAPTSTAHVCNVPDGLTLTPADLAMIAKDGPARPAPAVIAAAPLITTKPPIAGLTRVSAQDHRVGGWGFVR